MDKPNKQLVALRHGSKTKKLKKKHLNRLKKSIMEKMGVSEEEYYKLKRENRVLR